MNPQLNKLQTYPFEKLSHLKAQVKPSTDLPHISLALGEPKHKPPSFVLEQFNQHLDGFSHYTPTQGQSGLREAIAHWLTSRFQLKPTSLNPEQHILPVNGTREALFAFAQAIIDPTDKPLVISPNPFYQIYEGAALLAGAEPFYLNCTAENHYLPDLDNVPVEIWQRCQLFYLCSPGNPTGAVVDINFFKRVIELADQYDFIIASDECYSELYLDESQPPAGILQACAALGRDDFSRCVAFHSLSKRSNLPGLRSGFVAGDAEVMRQFLRYRTYHGCAMPLPTQHASIAAWQDEQHVLHNRDIYRAKFSAVTDILQKHFDFPTPTASFYLWPKTPIDDVTFTQQLYAEKNITVLPGSFLARPGSVDNINPGSNHVRIALVAEPEECITAAERLVEFIKSL